MKEHSNRIHFMDSMRSVLMMLGVVLHSSYIFDTKQDWLIYSNNNSIIANYIGASIHIFRMPAFFVVAGFFCVLTIKKYKPKNFLAIKYKRIVIPLIITGITLNSLETSILTNTNFLKLDLGKYIFEGGWIGHLWFLNSLIIYFLVAAGITSFLKGALEVLGEFLTRLFLSIPMAIIIFMMPIASVIILGLNKIGLPLDSNFLGVFNPFRILIYLPYFAFGTILGGNKTLLYKFSSINPLFSLLIVIVSTLTIQHISFQNEIIQKGILRYMEYLVVWFTVSLCFCFFYKFFNSQSKKWQFLSGASYTVYLFHHVLVIGIGYFLIQINFHPLINMLLLIFLTISMTLYIHKYFILKSKHARLLYNGK